MSFETQDCFTLGLWFLTLHFPEIYNISGIVFSFLFFFLYFFFTGLYMNEAVLFSFLLFPFLFCSFCYSSLAASLFSQPCSISTLLSLPPVCHSVSEKQNCWNLSFLAREDEEWEEVVIKPSPILFMQGNCLWTPLHPGSLSEFKEKVELLSFWGHNLITVSPFDLKIFLGGGKYHSLSTLLYFIFNF